MLCRLATHCKRNMHFLSGLWLTWAVFSHPLSPLILTTRVCLIGKGNGQFRPESQLTQRVNREFVNGEPLRTLESRECETAGASHRQIDRLGTCASVLWVCPGRPWTCLIGSSRTPGLRLITSSPPAHRPLPRGPWPHCLIESSAHRYWVPR
jgi:hypothetical protein